MPQLISLGDFQDIYIRLLQRGNLGFLGKVLVKDSQRTRQTFDHQYEISIWNMIPALRHRLNEKVSGQQDIPYEQHVIDQFLSASKELKLLSIGCGSASHELYFAQQGPFSLVHGIDLAPQLISLARKQANERGLTNCRFEVKDFFKESFSEQYDVVLFHQSLHHFADFDFILGRFVPQVLAPQGILVLNEYGGPTRFQWPRHQLRAATACLKELPTSHRQIFKTSLIKNKVYRPGWWRMKLSDPSESLNSEALRPKLAQYFESLEEKPLGGNLLHLVLKDIAHNFCDASQQSQELLEDLFKKEDRYLKKHPSDFFYGVYRPRANAR